MPNARALLLTDLVDSAALASRLGDLAMASLGAEHDRLARDLLRNWRGREIDKTDGFLLLFDAAADALGYALAYHRALAALATPLVARCGLHVGPVTLRQTPAADVALGAKPLEVDGLAKLVAARVMATALGGQILLTDAALAAIGSPTQRVMPHGHWRFKGLPEPLALFEIGDEQAPFVAPPDVDKAYRVVGRQGHTDGDGDGNGGSGATESALWLPVRAIRHSLPAERDAFIGRQLALADLARRFDGGARLVSLLGMGGTGKTRLATHFGWTALGEFAGGVWFCDLAVARDIDGLTYAVAQGLELPLGREDPVAQIGHAIAGRGACLLILDNFEQISRHAEATLGQWLGRAAQARFLVTTREVLGIAGEEALTLAPLPQADAELLFRRRALAARRDFKPGADDEGAIAPLVKLLDGLPLAIELAAARVRTLGPRAMLARMGERFKLLTSSGHRLERQSTLRVAFDWSWDMLSDADRTAFAQLSVMAGAFSLEAAEQVIALDDLPEAARGAWGPDLVQSLVDKSLLRALPGERFDMLISVQAYADDHLRHPGRYPGSGSAALVAAQGRHCAWYAALGPQRAVEHDCVDLDNLVMACRRAVGFGRTDWACGALVGAWAALALHGPYQSGVDLAQAVSSMPGLVGADAARVQTTLGSALEAAGRLAEARTAQERALGHGAAGQGGASEIEALISLGGLMGRAGQTDAARRTLQRALELARQQSEAVLACNALNGLGNLEFVQGRMDESLGHYEAALSLAKQSSYRRGECSVLGNMGNLNASCGRVDAARTMSEQALALARTLGDKRREGNTLSNLGLQYWTQGKLDLARSACDAALTVARDLGHPRLESVVLCNLGLVHEAMRQPEQASQHLEAALVLARRMGDPRAEGQVLGYLGWVDARLGKFAAARARIDAGQTLLREVDDALSLGVSLCQRAECEWLSGQRDAAKLALTEAQQIADQAGGGADSGSELGQALKRVDALFTLETAVDR